MRGWSRFVWPHPFEGRASYQPDDRHVWQREKLQDHRRTEERRPALGRRPAPGFAPQFATAHAPQCCGYHCIDGKGDSAKQEIEKAQALAGIVRTLLPTTSVTTTVKDAQGKEVYRDEQKVQDDQIPIFAGAIAVEVVEPLVEAKKDQAALKGLNSPTRM